MKLNENLVALRKKNHFTQVAVAKAVEVDLRAYKRYEYGERYPQLPVLVALANLYEISIDELVGHEIGKNEYR